MKTEKEITQNYILATQNWVRCKLCALKCELMNEIKKVADVSALRDAVADHWAKFLEHKTLQELKVKTQNLFVSADALIGESLDVKGGIESESLTTKNVSIMNGIYFNTSFSDEQPVAFDGEILRLVAKDSGKPITIFQDRTRKGLKLNVEYTYEGIWIMNSTGFRIYKLNKSRLLNDKPTTLSAIRTYYTENVQDNEKENDSGIEYIFFGPAKGLEAQIPDTFKLVCAMGKKFSRILISDKDRDPDTAEIKWEAVEGQSIKNIFFNMPGFDSVGNVTLDYSTDSVDGENKNIVFNFSDFKMDETSIIILETENDL